MRRPSRKRRWTRRCVQDVSGSSFGHAKTSASGDAKGPCGARGLRPRKGFARRRACPRLPKKHTINFPFRHAWRANGAPFRSFSLLFPRLHACRHTGRGLLRARSAACAVFARGGAEHRGQKSSLLRAPSARGKPTGKGRRQVAFFSAWGRFPRFRCPARSKTPPPFCDRRRPSAVPARGRRCR